MKPFKNSKKNFKAMIYIFKYVTLVKFYVIYSYGTVNW